jgi:hypothetical protein
MECIRSGHRQECLCYVSRLVHEGFFYCFRVSIHHPQVGAHGAFKSKGKLAVGLLHESIVILLIVDVLGVELGGRVVFLEGARPVALLLQGVAEAGVYWGIIGV